MTNLQIKLQVVEGERVARGNELGEGREGSKRRKVEQEEVAEASSSLYVLH